MLKQFTHLSIHYNHLLLMHRHRIQQHGDQRTSEVYVSWQSYCNESYYIMLNHTIISCAKVMPWPEPIPWSSWHKSQRADLMFKLYLWFSSPAVCLCHSNRSLRTSDIRARTMAFCFFISMCSYLARAYAHEYELRSWRHYHDFKTCVNYVCPCIMVIWALTMVIFSWYHDSLGRA